MESIPAGHETGSIGEGAPPRWEHFEHKADIGVRGFGRTLAESFEQAALALTAVATDPASVQASDIVQVECRAADTELLLADWLNTIIFEASTRGMLFGRFAAQINDGHLRGQLYGEPVDRLRHQPAVEAKGATYTELRVARQLDGLWVAQCVIDV
ncbi:MAG: archease [Gammaproteobacteria bacterium]|nr:archease [Gammaproteobacteria bacterium]